MTRLATSVCVFSVAVAAAGCGSSTPAPKTVAKAEIAEEEPEMEELAGPISVQSAIGGLSHEDVEATFASVWPRIEDCLYDGAERLETLGGQFKVVLRVDPKGDPRWAYLAESALGDRETEKCVIDAVMSRTWPRPLSGDGLAEKKFAIDAAENPVDLPDRVVEPTRRLVRQASQQCRQGIHGSFWATAHVASDGRVVAAGVAPPDEVGEGASDCIVEAIKGVRVGSRSKRPGKISFAID